MQKVAGQTEQVVEMGNELPSGKPESKKPEKKVEKKVEKKAEKKPVTKVKKGETTLPKSSVKKAEKKTWRDRMLAAFRQGQPMSVRNGKGGFLTLKEIYKRTHAESVGDMAAIRGILNRDCLEDSATFERNPKDRGMYRIRGNGKVETKAA